MIYGYARISPQALARKGTSLEEQTWALEAAGAEKICHDAFTGTRLEWPNFDRLMQLLQKDDIFIVTQLDCFARTAAEGYALTKELLDRGVRVHILNMGMIDNSKTGRQNLKIMSAFAQFERDMIVQRTQEGKAIAKLDPNFREGRPPVYTREQKQRAADLRKDGKTYTQIEHMTGISKSTLVRYMRYMEEYHNTGKKKSARDGLP